MEVFVLGSRDTLIVKGRDEFLDFLSPKIISAVDRNRVYILISRLFACSSASSFTFCEEGQISKAELQMALSLALGRDITIETVSVSKPKSITQIKSVNPRKSAGHCIFRRYLIDVGERSMRVDPELINQFNRCGKFGGFEKKVAEYLSDTPAFLGIEKRINLFTHSINIIPLVFIQLLITGKMNDAGKLERLTSKLTKCLPLGEDKDDPNKWLVAIA